MTLTTLGSLSIVLASVILLIVILLAMHLMSKIEQKFRDFQRNSYE